MRKLMWFTIGFTLACGVCGYGLMNPWLPLLSILAVFASVMLLICSGKKQYFRPALGVLLGCMTGIFWYGVFDAAYIRPVTELDGTELDLCVTATDYSRITDHGAVVDGTIGIHGKTYQAWIYLSEQTPIQPGDQLQSVFRIRLTTPGGMRESSVFQGKGVFLVADQREELTVLRPETIGMRYQPAVQAGNIKQLLKGLLSEDTSAFAVALLLGDTRDLSYELDTAFQISGIRHIVAVSGLHISILYSLVCMITLKKRFLTAAVGLPVLLVFAAAVGFTPSAVRACIMVGLMMLAQLFDREYDAPTALSFAVLVMLVWNPMAVMSASLQLSALCVAGILLFREPISAWLKEKFPSKKGRGTKLRGMLCGSISVSVSAMILTTPLCAYYFGMVSLAGILTNLLTLWVVNLIFNALVVLCFLNFAAPTVAPILAACLEWPIRYVQEVALAVASFPLAAVYTESVFIVIWLVFIYLLLAVFLIRKDRKPGGYLSLGIIGLCLALLLSWVRPMTAGTRITMLDVGQGQSIVLQSEGKTFLVDCGGNNGEEAADTATEYLLSQGIFHLDGVILTHYDLDHSGGIHHVLRRIDTDYLFLPDTRNDFDLPETEGTVLYVWNDLLLTFRENSLRLFGPVYSGQDNENSLCVLFDTESCDILITGDRSAFGERMLLRGRTLPDVDILVAGHHGSADAVSEELLREVTPETVLISVAEDNRYDHPSRTVLNRLKEFGCTVKRTDQEGTIIIRR